MAQQPLRPSNSRFSLAFRITIGVLALVALIVIGTTLASAPSSQQTDVDRAAPLRPAAATAPSSDGSALFSDEYVASLMDIPAFAERAQSETAAERRELAMSLASQGVARLDDAALAQRATHLSAVLDRLDDSLCFAVAVGMPLSSQQWSRVLKAMSASDSLGAWSSAWESAYRAAIVAELERRPGQPRDPKTSRAAVAALRRVCNDRERELFTHAGEAGSSMADFAAGLRLTYRKMPQLSRAEQAAVLRLMVQGPAETNEKLSDAMPS